MLKTCDDVMRKDGSFTTRDAASTWGVSESQALRRIRKLFDLGNIEFAGRVSSTSVSGVMIKVPSYRMKKQK